MFKSCPYKNIFQDCFFPQEPREARMEELMNLKQRRMSIKKYALKFHHLSRYAPDLVANIGVKMRKFTSRLSHLILESKTSLLIKDMDILRLVLHMQ